MRISDWSSDVCSSDLAAWHRTRNSLPSALRFVKNTMRLAIFSALSGAMLCMSASAVSGSAVPFPSTYPAIAANATVMRHGTVMIGNGQRLDDADVLLSDVKVHSVGSGLQGQQDADIGRAHV